MPRAPSRSATSAVSGGGRGRGPSDARRAARVRRRRGRSARARGRRACRRRRLRSAGRGARDGTQRLLSGSAAPRRRRSRRAGRRRAGLPRLLPLPAPTGSTTFLTFAGSSVSERAQWNRSLRPTPSSLAWRPSIASRCRVSPALVFLAWMVCSAEMIRSPGSRAGEVAVAGTGAGCARTAAPAGR